MDIVIKKLQKIFIFYFYFISLLFYAPLILGCKLCFCTFDTRLQVVFYILYVFFVSQMFGTSFTVSQADRDIILKHFK